MGLTSKTLFRTIRSTIGRYISILAIVALGVGFFTGLKSARPSMQITGDNYLSQCNMYDFRLMSTLGITKKDISAFSQIDGVEMCEGGYDQDAVAKLEGYDEPLTLQILSLPENIGLPKLVQGKNIGRVGECLADSAFFSPDDIGKIINLSDDNDEDTLDSFRKTRFKIVGLVQSPQYISTDRGNTSVGSGTRDGFVYVLSSAFDSSVFHEAYIKTDTDAQLFSDEYDDYIADIKPAIEDALSQRALMRYGHLRTSALEEIAPHQKEFADGWEEYNKAIDKGIPAKYLEDSLAELNDAQKEIDDALAKADDIKRPSTYILGLDENSGCASFKNDIVIVDGIANAFPVFFVLIAALVCITTMTRMVNEERTQIGTLKALGYSDSKISQKYILYAASSSLIGCVLGFFLGSSLIPKVIWAVYNMSYGFAPLTFYFGEKMYICCLCIAFFGSILVTVFACRNELRGKPADLIRPKAPNNGKRILLEHITPLWKRLSFLNKVTIRNVFRYKRRMIMMLLGIGGCTALMITGFGLKDSVANILDYQYDEIMHYDACVSYDSKPSSRAKLKNVLNKDAETFTFAYMDELTIISDTGSKDVNIIACPGEDAEEYFSLHNDDTIIDYPEGNNAVISSKSAKQLNLAIGDKLSVKFGDKKTDYIVSGICDNYFDHYVYVSCHSVPDFKENTVFLKTPTDTQINPLAVKLRGLEGVDYVNVAAEQRAIMGKSMSAMNYIVALVILFAGALAFVVLYNLTNINIMERIREVATVKVLGFNSSETASYILRENIILSFMGGLLGLGLGKILHWYVMLQVQVDAMAFDIRVAPLSYVISFACTIIFALIANFLMRFKLDKVNMAESLKSVE